MNKKLKIIISWCLVIIWMGIIFNFSNMDTNESNTKSKNTIEKVVDTTIDTSNKIGITKEEIDNDKKEDLTEKLNKPLRKCMHASVYFVLALLLLNAFNILKKNIPHKYLIVIIICFLYACTDEYHQTFVNGRTGQFKDVLIDTTGSIIALIIYNIIIYSINKRKNKHIELDKKVTLNKNN